MQPSSVTHLELTEVIPAVEPPKDTKYIRHLRMQSNLLTEFWGRPVFLNASVLVPRDFDESTQHYPVAFYQNYFSGDFRGFRETPPTGNAGHGNEAAASQFYQDWTSGPFVATSLKNYPLKPVVSSLKVGVRLKPPEVPAAAEPP